MAQAQPGRKRDQSLDGALLDATLDVLAEVGAAGLTMDAVALRASSGKAALYRRWSSKSDLIIAAVSRMKRNQVDLANLPDTGTLRGDLLALFRPEPIEQSTRKLKIMAALASLLSQDQTLAEAANSAIVEPWAEAHLVLMEKAVARGEIPATADIATLSQVIPSMAAYRSLVQRRAFELSFLVSMIDTVVLPALRHPPSDQPALSKSEPAHRASKAIPRSRNTRLPSKDTRKKR
ncbi:Transcriptional regulator, TetR family [Labilithrix luteola]|uniref:Transcriptional regulator, TetR family n=1 Tax=Labilithrix luteola TaxID=1391654 RepID=A0A0K1PQ67_9BACT|nr:Transcriptional regulator, TetR family [Labilithrix luteola]